MDIQSSTTQRSNIWFVALSVILAIVGLFGLSCLLRPAHQPAQASSIKVGFIPDIGGLSGLYNWTSYQGLLRAESELGVVGTVYTSTSSDDYAVNLQKCADEGNDLCISVGFLLGEVTGYAAISNPSTKFAIVDYTFGSYTSNLRSIAFRPEEAAYLGGTLAGLMTQSDIVGDIGGMEIPSVVAYTEDYRNGAICANPDVTVLLTYTNNFANRHFGAQVAQTLIGRGADVVFAAAGDTGNGAVLTATQSNVWGIGVDSDSYINLFNNGTISGSNFLLSSVIKKLDNAVFFTIQDVVSGTFTSGVKIYDLANDGVGLAPFHETDSAIPQSTKDRLEFVKQGIIKGIIDVNSQTCKSWLFTPLIMRNASP